MQVAFLMIGSGLLGMIIAHAITSGPRAGRTRDRPEQDDDKTRNTARQAVGTTPEWADIASLVAEIQSEHKQQNTRERTFWGRQIRVSSWLNWVTGVGAAVGLFGLYFLYRSVVGADQATIEANRAWVGTTWLIVHNDSPDKDIPIEIHLVNFGKSPALQLSSHFEHAGPEYGLAQCQSGDIWW
jgi:hypothetical protein